MKNLPQPRKVPRQARSAQMVESIIEATARVLASHGYEGTNTNLIAEYAGVSVGSIYQYFPNKEALVVAVHDRHIRQVGEIVDKIMSECDGASLQTTVTTLVRAVLTAHMLQPQLHRVLIQDLPIFAPSCEQSPAIQGFFGQVKRMLSEWRDQIVPNNHDAASWIIMHIIKNLVHAAITDPPLNVAHSALYLEITNAVIGYLTVTPAPRTPAGPES